MATNDFIPFAIAGGANVEAPATWAADPVVPQGFVAGVAASIKVNTALRQACFVAAMIAQFTADNQPGNVQDNGVLATLEAQFEAALKAYIGTAYQPLLPSANYYVGGTGASDSNDGLALTVTGGHGPWATLQHAVNVLQSYNFAGLSVTVHVANGTYTSGLIANGPFVGAAGPAAVSFIGNTGTPGSCIIDVTSASCFVAQAGATFTVQGFKLQATGSGANGIGLLATNFSQISFQSIDFDTCNNIGILSQAGSTVNATGSYSITGGAVSHVEANQSGTINISGITITVTPGLNFSGQFAVAQVVSSINVAGTTFTSTTATCSRYLVQSNSVIYANGVVFPGNSAGTDPYGGQYI